jgi:hypothetical protein
MHLEPIGADILPNLQGPKGHFPGPGTNETAAPPRANDCFGNEPAIAPLRR